MTGLKTRILHVTPWIKAIVNGEEAQFIATKDEIYADISTLKDR